MKPDVLGLSKTNPSPVMLHNNVAELRLLVDTFTHVWSSGGQANLSLQTKDSQMWANLDLQQGPAGVRRPGPPEAGGGAGGEPRNYQTRHSQTVLLISWLGSLQSDGMDRQLGLAILAGARSGWKNAKNQTWSS